METNEAKKNPPTKASLFSKCKNKRKRKKKKKQIRYVERYRDLAGDAQLFDIVDKINVRLILSYGYMCFYLVLYNALFEYYSSDRWTF